MKQNLLVIGGGILQVPLIETALSMGLHVIVFDMSAEAPGVRIASESVIMSTRDIEGCVREARRLHRRRNLNGVITAATDASRAVAAIAASLELPGIRFADAEAASNKILMRRRLAERGLPIPRFQAVWSLKEAREALSDFNLPVVLKPADNMGARGVIRISNRSELPGAFRHSKRNSPTGEMILEEYMVGPELSLDALAWRGNFRLTGIADRIIEHEPFFVEIGHNMPSSLDPAILLEAERVMFSGMRALGIHTGAGKGDLKVTPAGVMIGEIAARLSGGYMSSHTYPLHSGVNLLRAAIQIALGQDPDQLEPVKNLVAVERGIIGPPGKIMTLSGEDQIRALPGIELVSFTRQVGDVLIRPTSNMDKVGHIIAVGETPARAEERVQAALGLLRLTVDDSYGIDWAEVEATARNRLGENICRVCRICDGQKCSSGIPGMGGVGNMTSFRDNIQALSEIKILPRYIRSSITPDSALELFGRKFEHPIMTAPVTGALTNLQGAISEYDLSRILLQAARESGSIAWLGDGATPEKILVVLEALQEVDNFGIPIFKPRSDTAELVRRLKQADELGLPALGIDIDAISLRTMVLRNESSTARSYDELCRIREPVRTPFILKGIVTPQDADLAVRAGFDAIVVSNHGGRVLDDMPGTARILPSIVSAVGRRIPILVDGGIRSGLDVFKMLALGATAVLIGRPAVIAAVGGETSGIKYLLSRYRDELLHTMTLCGTGKLSGIDRSFLYYNHPIREEEKAFLFNRPVIDYPGEGGIPVNSDG